MQLLRLVIATSILAAIVVACSGAMKIQEPNELEKRVEMLELRVQKLESILFATSQLSLMDARQQLEQANSNLESSRKLHLKGFITQAQLDLDRFKVQQARRELDLVQAEDRQQIIVGEIDLLEAQRALKVAEDDLIHTQRLFDRGFVSQRELQGGKDLVLRNKRRLAAAEAKARAAEELLELGKQQAAPQKNSSDENSDSDQTDKQ